MRVRFRGVLRVKRVEKLLTCPYGDAIGEAVYRPLAGLLLIVAPDGTELVPEQGGVHLNRAEQELAAAPGSAERDAAQARLDFLRRQVGELIYDLPCLRGHRVLATAPQIIRAIRRAMGKWAQLAIP
jgi:hypothetical protein